MTPSQGSDGMGGRTHTASTELPSSIKDGELTTELATPSAITTTSAWAWSIRLWSGPALKSCGVGSKSSSLSEAEAALARIFENRSWTNPLVSTAFLSFCTNISVLNPSSCASPSVMSPAPPVSLFVLTISFTMRILSFAIPSLSATLSIAVTKPDVPPMVVPMFSRKDSACPTRAATAVSDVTTAPLTPETAATIDFLNWMNCETTDAPFPRLLRAVPTFESCALTSPDTVRTCVKSSSTSALLSVSISSAFSFIEMRSDTLFLTARILVFTVKHAP